MDDLEFVNALPAAAARKGKWERIANALTERPGEWAKIRASGGYPRERLKALGCEVRVVRGVLYARWPRP